MLLLKLFWIGQADIGKHIATAYRDIIVMGLVICLYWSCRHAPYKEPVSGRPE
jgi:hypothetical protein